MTPEEAKRFQGVFSRLDSSQLGERESALQIIHEKQEQKAWPRFVDVIQPLGTTVPLAQYQKLESDLAAWMARANQLLNQNQILRAGLGFIKAVKLTAIAASAAIFVCGSYHLLWPSSGAASPQESETSSEQREEVQPPAKDDSPLARAMLVVMQDWREWGTRNAPQGGDSPPVVHFVSGKQYWVIIRRDTDSKTYADVLGKPITRHCQHYFAAEAEWDREAQFYLAPHPYGLFHRMTWPEIASYCE